MANDDLLQQFDKLIQQRLEANNKQLRQEVREDVKAEVEPLHERMDTQHKNLSRQISTVEKNLTGKIDQQAHEVADILAQAVMPDIDRHEEQITELQEAVGLRPKH